MDEGICWEGPKFAKIDSAMGGLLKLVGEGRVGTGGGGEDKRVWEDLYKFGSSVR